MDQQEGQVRPLLLSLVPALQGPETFVRCGTTYTPIDLRIYVQDREIKAEILQVFRSYDLAKLVPAQAATPQAAPEPATIREQVMVVGRGMLDLDDDDESETASVEVGAGPTLFNHGY
jgi:hypothetical protein